MLRHILFILFFFVLSHTIVGQEKTLEEGNDAILLQGFHWESHQSSWWNTLAEKSTDIKKSGFDLVWFPPSSFSASDEGYLPNRLYFQNSRYGSEKELKKAIRSFHQLGVKVLADIVVNHRVGTKNWADFTEPQWGSHAVCSNDEWPGATGNQDTGLGFHAGRDLDHTQIEVQRGIQDWLTWLKKDMGYDGWRYDYVKGYGGHYVGLYNDASQPYFSVGEYWDDLDLNNPNAHRQRLCDWINATQGKSSAFDFTTKGVLQHAVAHSEYWRLKDPAGKPVGLLGWWPERTVTFIDNHDTGPSPKSGQNHWAFPSDKIMQGYAYILTHPGVPTVYWVHFYDWGLGDLIKALIQIRKAQKIHSMSGVDIRVADAQKYAAIIDGKVAVKIGSGDWSPGNNWVVATSGNDYAVWTQK